MFDGEYWLSMTPVRKMYVTVGTDTANFDSMKYTGTPVKFTTPDLEMVFVNLVTIKNSCTISMVWIK